MKFALRTLIIGSWLFMSSVAFAASGGEGIPTKLVLIQSYNLLIVIVLLTYILRPKIQSYFSQRRADYDSALKAAFAAKEEAERKKAEIARRLQQLKATREESLKRAQTEAEELRKKILSDGQTLAQKLEKEATRTAEFEAERAVNQLRTELLQKSVELAHKTLKERVGPQDQKRLEIEFVEKIQAVQ